MLVNIKDWCKNTFEVVNQFRVNTENSHHRYDVMLLINGVPAVQIELKTLGISHRRAMERIVDYKNDSGNGYAKTSLCFIQLLIVSNRTDTWHFADNNARHFAFDAEERFLPVYQFAVEDNAKITHLDDFADRFLVKCALGWMISRYMVLIAGERKLLMMRPYRIYAVKAVVDRIDKNRGNGYIWHTTGSGETLTSLKASTLLKANENVHKSLIASAVIDHDYIMKLIADYSSQDPKKLTISRERLIGLILSGAKFLGEREDITEYVRSLRDGEGLDEAAIRAGYERFKDDKRSKEIAAVAQARGLTTEALAAFIETILQRMVFDGEHLTDLMAPLELDRRERRERELALMNDLVPFLNRRADGRKISGLNVYEREGA